jgi:hypothetical protein
VPGKDDAVAGMASPNLHRLEAAGRACLCAKFKLSGAPLTLKKYLRASFSFPFLVNAFRGHKSPDPPRSDDVG